VSDEHVSLIASVLVSYFAELLKPEGDLIPVTSENRIEYIHLVADYKLNRQIRNQCNAFRLGHRQIYSLDCLPFIPQFFLFLISEPCSFIGKAAMESTYSVYLC
jgi:hypothetical protein